MASQQVWLITGASSGFGTVLAEKALRLGYKVIATARNPAKAAQQHPEIEALGGQWLQLDVNSAETKQKVEAAIKEAGRIDVVVNNAGYSILGSVEDMRYSSPDIYLTCGESLYLTDPIVKRKYTISLTPTYMVLCASSKRLFHTCARKGRVPSSTLAVLRASPVGLRRRYTHRASMP